MPVFNLCVQVIRSLGPATCVNDCAGVAIVAVQTLVAAGADHPHNRIIDPISSCNPRRALTVLANGASRDYGGRIGRSNFISRNSAAPVTRTVMPNPITWAVSRIFGTCLLSTWIERWILSWGTHTHVLEPSELRQRIANTSSALANTYLGE